MRASVIGKVGAAVALLVGLGVAWEGGALAEGLDGVTMDLQAQGGEIAWRDLSPYPDEAAARAAFGVRPKASDIDLSLRLIRGDRVISETWRYLWTA